MHIPFCKQACYYCDFHFSTNISVKNEMLLCIAKELELQRNYITNSKASTIYFGGGTPSLLEIVEIKSLLKAIINCYKFDTNVEITLEANPDDLTLEKLSELKSIGINRLSIGVQSFQDKNLSYLNRVHNSQTAINAVFLARKAGFTNLSIDLIYGIPGSTNEMWKNDLLTAISLNPEHISAYCLTIEKKTVFGNWQKHNKLTPETEDNIIYQFKTLVKLLTINSYEHYEISNFCKPGLYSVHNMNYWKNQVYLGVGPGAHSYNKETRQYNIANNHLYLKNIREGIVPCTIETLTIKDHINEYILTNLRTQWGCDLNWIKNSFKYDLQKEKQEYLDYLNYNNIAIIDEGSLILTLKGKLLTDKIISDLFLI